MRPWKGSLSAETILVGLTTTIEVVWAFLVARTVKNLLAMQKTHIRFLGHEDPLEEGMATHSSIVVWRIPRTEESGGLQSMG